LISLKLCNPVTKGMQYAGHKPLIYSGVSWHILVAGTYIVIIEWVCPTVIISKAFKSCAYRNGGGKQESVSGGILVQSKLLRREKFA